jgi:hypothetical protein
MVETQRFGMMEVNTNVEKKVVQAFYRSGWFFAAIISRPITCDGKASLCRRCDRVMAALLRVKCPR